MGMLTEREVRLVVRKEIKQSYGHLSLREQKELEEQFLAGLKGMFGGAKKAVGQAAGAAGAAAQKAAVAVKDAAGTAAQKAGGAVAGAAQKAAVAVKDAAGALKAKAEEAKKAVGDVTKGITDAYNSGKAEALEAEATKLETTAQKLRADATALKGGQIAESVIRKLRKLERQRRRS